MPQHIFRSPARTLFAFICNKFFFFLQRLILLIKAKHHKHRLHLQPWTSLSPTQFNIRKPNLWQKEKERKKNNKCIKTWSFMVLFFLCFCFCCKMQMQSFKHTAHVNNRFIRLYYLSDSYAQFVLCNRQTVKCVNMASKKKEHL